MPHAWPWGVRLDGGLCTVLSYCAANDRGGRTACMLHHAYPVHVGQRCCDNSSADAHLASQYDVHCTHTSCVHGAPAA